MLRRLFTLLSAVSLLLYVATCVLWARSDWREDSVGLCRWTEEDPLIRQQRVHLTSDRFPDAWRYDFVLTDRCTRPSYSPAGLGRYAGGYVDGLA